MKRVVYIQEKNQFCPHAKIRLNFATAVHMSRYVSKSYFYIVNICSGMVCRNRAMSPNFKIKFPEFYIIRYKSKVTLL